MSAMTHVSCVPAATDLADFNFHAFTGPDEKPRSFIQTDSLFSAHSGLQSQRPDWSGRTLWDFALLCFDYFVVSSFMFDSLKTENSQTVILIGGSPNTVVHTHSGTQLGTHCPVIVNHVLVNVQ